MSPTVTGCPSGAMASRMAQRRPYSSSAVIFKRTNLLERPLLCRSHTESVQKQYSTVKYDLKIRPWQGARGRGFSKAGAGFLAPLRAPGAASQRTVPGRSGTATPRHVIRPGTAAPRHVVRLG